MSQWGEVKHFKRGDTIIRVLSHVSTPGFSPACDTSVVDKLSLIHVTGDTSVAVAMLRELETRFLGKPHSKWLNQAIAMPQPGEWRDCGPVVCVHGKPITEGPCPECGAKRSLVVPLTRAP